MCSTHQKMANFLCPGARLTLFAACALALLAPAVGATPRGTADAAANSRSWTAAAAANSGGPNRPTRRRRVAEKYTNAGNGAGCQRVCGHAVELCWQPRRCVAGPAAAAAA